MAIIPNQLKPGAPGAAAPNPDFWRGRRVLLTGHTGFKGSWLALWLSALGAKVHGLALAPATTPNLWSAIKAHGGVSRLCDIRDRNVVAEAMAEAAPEVVIHMAAQALVRPSYEDPIGTYATNIMGTAHVLEAARRRDRIAATLVVTSDKVYENHGHNRPFVEGDRLGGHDPYSNSKACTELVVQSFRTSYWPAGRALGTARAGNVIGGGDWSADRLIPDCVRALAAKQPVRLRYPDAVRPWQHVLEPLSGYIRQIESMVLHPGDTPEAINFGPAPEAFRSVSEVVELFSARFDGRPGWEAEQAPAAAEAVFLTLSSDLAHRTLGWQPRLPLETALDWTADWYRAHRDGADMVAYSLAQIEAFQDAQRQGRLEMIGSRS